LGEQKLHVSYTSVNQTFNFDVIMKCALSCSTFIALFSRDNRNTLSADMSLLKYFTPIEKSPNKLVEGNSVTNILTERETEEISNQLQKQNGKRLKKYMIWTPGQRAEIGQHAATKGNTCALLYLKEKYPELTKQTVSDFAKAYRELNGKSESEILGIKKKRIGRPTLLPEDLMKKILTLLKRYIYKRCSSVFCCD